MLLIGNTGVGKSTLINYMSKNKLLARKNKGGDIEIINGESN